MKHFIAGCCILMGAASTVSAQQSVAPKQEVVAQVSKSEFSEKVAELDQLLRKSKKEDGEVLFTEINKMANTELGITRGKMRTTQNDADKKKYGDLTMSQRNTFAAALKLRQQDIVANRQAIIEKLSAFANLME